MLNLRVEISDEIIEFFGYSLYERNQKKSMEAKALFEKLFLELQSELQKEYQTNAQHLSNLDNRLGIVERSAAYSEDVEWALNKLNNKITRIEFNVDNYKRQQDAIAAQVETTVNQLYATLNDKIEKLEKNFNSKLNSEVEKAVEVAVKKILATDLSGVIQKVVENTVKDSIPAPAINEKIQAEVAKAVGNIQPPNFSHMIQAEVAKAVRNIPPPNFSSTIQAEVAKAVKEERQKTQAGNAIYPSSYLALEQQRTTIQELKKLVDTQQKVIEDLKARLSAIEGKTANATVEPTAEEYTPLNIRDESSWLKYKSRLKNIGKLKLFAKKNPVEFKIFASRLNRIENAIDKIKLDEFDEYTTETITDKTVEIVKGFIDVLDNCRHKIGNPAKNSIAAKELYNLIEEYLSGLGIRSMNFKVGDDYNEWADLAMSEQPIIEGTSEKRKHNTLKEIHVQPHYIEFINEHDKKIRRVFGGRCVAYAYEDKGDEYGRVLSRN